MVQLVRSSSPRDAGHFAALAQQLAFALRSSRLTVVVAPAAAGKTSLLDGVRPLLRRRAIDTSPAARTGGSVVVPFPDRRSRTEAGPQHERIYTMAHWDDASLAVLQRALDEGGPVRGRRALADAITPGNLADHAERLDGARLLFVFDHFEELLEAGRIRVGQRRLLETWAAAVRSPQLRANFLVAVDERSWPWMHAMCMGLPHGTWRALRLDARGDAPALVPMGTPTQAGTSVARLPQGITPRLATTSSGPQFLNSVNERVRRVARTAHDERNPAAERPSAPPQVAEEPPAAPASPPMTGDAPAETVETAATAPMTMPAPAIVREPDASPATTPSPVAEPDHTAAPAPIDSAATPAPAAAIDTPLAPSLPAMPTTATVPHWPRPALLALVLLATAASAAVWWRFTAGEAPWTSSSPAKAVAEPVVAPAATPALTVAPTPAATTAPAASAATVTAAATPTAPATPAAFGALGAGGGTEHVRLAGELIAALPTGAVPPKAETLSPGQDVVAWLQQAPGRLGIAHLDALRAAPQGAPAVPLHVLTPLFAEPVLFIVRADSPLRTLRQLRDQRIAVGPTNGNARHSVREVLRRLLGTAPELSVARGPDEALAELVAFQSIDALAVVDAQPMAWWNALDPAVTRRLRVLTLDPTQVQDQRLLDGMGTHPLHVRLAGAGGSVALVPGVMSYLVASGDPDPERLAAMAQALCRELPRLQQQGHPTWRDLHPRGQTDTGWPVASAFRTPLSRCVR